VTSGQMGEASLRARIASFSRWAMTSDRTAATAAARSSFDSRFERQVDPDGVMTAKQRAACAESARKAYYHRLAYLSVKARRKGRGNR